ncbi:major facilitator superfamily protein [Hirsutella rhossiliensis]|uniref:Sugar transporter domain-containing protein n=1 Tax=Hirsutella rhossiliensis TaxID=111463 RepID=A0A9P8MUE3_9HYPO|nr:sugar transporter domain-containing protein [Hirsutella rhossiliensis]KAH0962308.1 sugar transporter domain-containing protein [Hirsutella rhossiliensis]
MALLESGPPPAVVAKTSGGNSAYHNFHNDFAHVADVNERRRLALAEIDKAPFGWYHVRACVVAGVGFFTDSYDIFTASLLTIMLGIVYYPGSGVMPANSDNAIKLATSAGTVVGQLGFGYLADVVGRKRIYGLELIVIIFATVGQALTSGSPACDIIGLIIFWRVIMGIGIGGDYPLSSIITSEFATTKWRGAMMAAVFAMQGLGQLGAALVMLFVTLGFKSHLEPAPTVAQCDGDCRIAVDKMWRTLIGIGAVPACIALYFRLTIPETPRYTFDVARDVEKAQDDVKAYMSGKPEGEPDAVTRVVTNAVAKNKLEVPKASWTDFFRHYGKLKNFSLLLGTAGSWFCLDVAFYGLSLNNGTILGVIGYSTKNTNSVYDFLYKTAVGNLVIVLAGAVPGYWVSVGTIDILGRKKIQMGGFIILTVLFIAMGFAYNSLSSNGLLAIYVLAQFFFNFGPNTTTFIVPGEVFPTRYRSTSHGISAASGKIGSIIGQGAISTLRTRGATKANPSPWMNHVLQIYALFMLLGCFTTLLIPETARRTLEELNGEDDYAAQHSSPAVITRGQTSGDNDEGSAKTA